MAGNLASVAAGGIAVVLAAVDVFYTVLFPGSGHGPIRRPLARAVQTAFRQARHLPAQMRRRVLAYAGPVEVTATLLSWFLVLLCGWAAIYRPALGTAVSAAQGPTDPSWGTALYFSGYNLTTLGLGDLVATTPAYRVLVVVEAATGFMAFTLAISYFVSVYSTLNARNTFALALRDRSGGTGRGSVVVGALWAEGPVAAALHLDSMAGGLRHLVQTHSAYPVLRSFRYRRPYAALPHILHTCWETTTLIRTSIELSDGARPELTGSALDEIEAAAREITHRLDSGPPRTPVRLHDTTRAARWRKHHADALAALTSAGVPVRCDSVERYVEVRAGWDAALAGLAGDLLFDWPEGLGPDPDVRQRARRDSNPQPSDP